MTPFWLTAFLDFAPDDYERGVVFWAEVTGSDVSPSRGGDLEFATLVPADGDDYLRVQCLRDGPSRIHLDLHVPDPRAAADRAAALGATELADHGYVVMESPAGVPLCFVSHPASRRPSPAVFSDGRSQVDGVVVEVAADAVEAERAFWQDLVGEASAGDEALRLSVRPAALGPAGSAHLVMAADDPEAEVVRQLLLGARRAPGIRSDDGIVLLDPTGTAYVVGEWRNSEATSASIL